MDVTRTNTPDGYTIYTEIPQPNQHVYFAGRNYIIKRDAIYIEALPSRWQRFKNWLKRLAA